MSRPWKRQHSTQGFLWEPDSVTVATLWHCDELHIEVYLDEPLTPTAGAARALVAPFTVTAAGRVLVTTFVEGDPIDLAPGDYALLYETGRFDDPAEAKVPGYEELVRMWARFVFSRETVTEAHYLIVDEQLSLPDKLHME
jgi:hypothetical protein